MVYSDFDKLEAFFIELRDTNFHPERMRSKLVINGQWTTINQGECFNLLRQRIPDLQGKDDKELVEYLKDPKKVKDRIIGKLIKSESDKLTKAVEEKPAPTEAVGGEAVPQNTATEQAGTTGQATGASSGSLPFGMPSGPAISPVIHPVPRVPPPAPPVGGREGGTGEGTAATRKINKQANLTSTKVKQPTNRFNFPAFRSKVGGGVVKFGSSAMGIANPFLGRMGNQVIGGLTRIANPLGGGGAGSRSIFGRFSRGGGVRFFGGAGRGVSSLGQTAKKSRALLALVALLGFMALVGGIAIITGTNPTGTTPPGGTAPAAGNDKDIASCTFYRGGDSTPGIRFNIPEWPTLITDVATKVGVPPSIVAGILRVECPGCFSTTDPSYIKNDFDDHNSFDDKTQLPVAFGVTQFTASTFAGLDVNTDIKPKFPEKTGLSLPWIRQKDFVDKYHGNILDGSGNPITQQRYTNPTDDFYKSKTDNLMRIYSVRDSIIATAVKAKKDAGVNPPYDQNTVNKIANSYYGGCEYIQNEQIHSYCDDLWNSYSQCQNASAPAPVPPAGETRPSAPTVEKDKLRDSLIAQFGMTMNGFDGEHLQWAWEKLWDVSNTNFIALTKGSIIVQDSYSSAQVGCPGPGVAVYLNQYPETLFKYALIHELGHVIRNCNKTPISRFSEHLNALDKEKGVTYYANNAWSCTRSDNPSEDYAEMIALYLNPSANIQMVKCAPASTKYTNLATDFPLHYNVARSVLGAY